MNIFFLLLSFALAYTPPEEKPSFSQMEINHIRVTTPGLFDNEKLLELHLEQIPDTAYCFPLPGGKVISPYGRGGGRHSGIDIKTCAKDTIRSAFDGIVRMSKPYSAYGNVIVVRHSSGLETIYSHNFKNLVQSGDVVKAGQPDVPDGPAPNTFILKPASTGSISTPISFSISKKGHSAKSVFTAPRMEKASS